MRAEDVVGGAQRVVGADDLGEGFVQEVHARTEIDYFDGASPGAQAGRDSEGRGGQLLIQFGDVGADRGFDLMFEARVHVGQGEHGHPAAEAKALFHIGKHFQNVLLVGLAAVSREE